MLNQIMKNLDFQGQALVLRAHRQQVLASNIANADTPGYVAREFDFRQALMQTTGVKAQQTSLSGVAVTNSAHMRQPIAGSVLESGGQYALSSQPSADNNTVDMDRERASFAENALHYEATLRFINGSVKTMLSAIQGQ